MADLKQLYHDLVRFETELWNAIDASLRAECDTPLTWFEVMQLLARRPGCRVQDIAEEFAITVGGVSKVVDRIEAAGFARRRANPGDRRSSLIELTPAGRSRLADAMSVFERELQLRIGLLPERSLIELGATLGRLRAAGHDADAAARPGR